MKLLNKAYEILEQVRWPQDIHLMKVDYSFKEKKVLCAFKYPRAKNFPNPDLLEVTGGQLMDALGQAGYVLVGLLENDGFKTGNVDYEGFLKIIHGHRSNFVNFEPLNFFHPTDNRLPFYVEVKVTPFSPDTEDFFKVFKKPHKTFVLLKLSMRLYQKIEDKEYTNVQAQGVFCERLTEEEMKEFLG